MITFALSNFRAEHRLAAHASSVATLQLEPRAGVLITGGNDGRVRVFDARTGAYIRELVARGEGVWKVVLNRETCAVMCKRAGKTVVEIWSMHPRHCKASARAVLGSEEAKAERGTEDEGVASASGGNG